MSKSLIIAEKPSVAADIARALGGFARHDDYFESDRYVLSSAVGHLLEIGMPEEEEVKRGKWTFAHLPAIPTRFELKPIEKNANRLRTLLKLLKPGGSAWCRPTACRTRCLPTPSRLRAADCRPSSPALSTAARPILLNSLPGAPPA
jgi:hypothetical protein